MILALIDHDKGQLNAISLQALTLARKLATDLGVALESVIVGEEARGLATQLQQYGVSKVYIATHSNLTDYAPEAWAESLVQIAKAKSAKAVITPGTERGNEVLAYVAAKCDAPMAANVTSIQAGEPYEITRIRWGGSLLEDATLTGDIKLLSVAPHIFAEEIFPASSFTTEDITPELSSNALRVKIVRRDIASGDKVSLTEAKLVISGGRGVGSAEGFKPLEELASIVGAAVGCSEP